MTQNTDNYRQQAVTETLKSFEVQAARRIGQYGYNEIEEKEEPLWSRVFRRFWGAHNETVAVPAPGFHSPTQQHVRKCSFRGYQGANARTQIFAGSDKGEGNPRVFIFTKALYQCWFRL